MAKRKKSKAFKALEVPLGLGFGSIASNLTGSALTPLLPVGTVNPLTRIGTSAAQFAGVAGTISLAGLSLSELKKLQPKKKRKK